MQDEDPAPLNVPAEQWEQDEAPAPLNLPAEQLEQDEAPAPLYVPAVQGEQAAESQYFPAMHVEAETCATRSEKNGILYYIILYYYIRKINYLKYLIYIYV